MSNPLLTIIIPCFNASKTIKAALESINDQTFSDYEVLIIDALSTDNTKSIVEQFSSGNNRIKWISERDKGIYDAMNKGISLSNGKWIYFLGADDTLYRSDLIFTVSQLMNKTDVSVLYGDVKLNGSTAWAKDGEIYAGKFDLKKLLAQNICHQAIFYRRDIFDVIGLFNISYKICADWDFNLKCFARFKFDYVNMIVANYCGGGTSKEAVDIEFSKDKLYNIVRYYKNTLYRKEFVKYRTYFRRMIIARGAPIGLMLRVRLLLSFIILKLQSEQKDFNHL